MAERRRRSLLSTLAVVGLAGCLDTLRSSDATPTNRTESDSLTDSESATSPSEGETATSTPEDEIATSTPENEGATPTPGEETQTPPSETETPTPTPDEELTPPPPDTDEDEAVFPGYEMTTVVVESPERDLLGWVRAAIADTRSTRYTGLSDTDELPDHYGMVFVFDSVDDRTFVMREMDFGIDIVYADDDGRITSIHHARAPEPGEDGNDQRYSGRGQFVLEVNYEWTTDRGVEVGDYIQFDR